MDRVEKIAITLLAGLLAILVLLLFWAILMSKSGRELSEEHLGGDTVCDANLLCIKAGIRYECVTHNRKVACAQLGRLERP